MPICCPCLYAADAPMYTDHTKHAVAASSDQGIPVFTKYLKKILATTKTSVQQINNDAIISSKLLSNFFCIFSMSPFAKMAIT